MARKVNVEEDVMITRRKDSWRRRRVGDGQGWL